ncbi:MAG: hypothetical protein ACOYJZ_07490, partial [Acutalibacter sp.]
MRKNKLTCFVSGLLAAALLMWGMPALAEGEDDAAETPDTSQEILPTGINVTFTNTSDLILDEGDTGTLYATVSLTYDGTEKPSTEPNVTVQWSQKSDINDYEPVELPQKETSLTGAGTCSAEVKGNKSGRVDVTVTVSVLGKSGEIITDTATKGVEVTGLVVTDSEGKVCSDGTPVEIIQGSQEQLTCHTYGDIKGAVVDWINGSSSVAYVVQGMVTGQTIGETEITASYSSYKAVCKIQVVENSNRIIKVSYEKREPLSMKDLAGELDSNCQKNLGEDVLYVRGLSVSPNQGVLYYHYVSSGNTGSGVGAAEVYYIHTPESGQLDFNYITFVPNPEFTGDAEINFTAYGVSGDSYAGVIRISVKGQADVAYTTAGDPVHFEVDDFAAIYRQVTAGSSLRSVRFQLPSAIQGTLYYDYDVTDVYIQRVEAGKDYYRDSNPRLDLVSFLPSPGFVGTVSISYTAVGSGGTQPHNGTLTITVEDSNEESQTLQNIQYTCGESGVTMDGNDFADACSAATGKELNYVFLTTLPANGKLYSNYGSSDQKELDQTGVGKTAFFVKKVLDSDLLLSNLTYVPTVTTQMTDSFTYKGVDREGNVVEGTVQIQANVPGSSAIRYSGTSLPVRFRASDFSNACQTILSSDLSYITFLSLPDSSAGHLYLGFESVTDKGT